MLSEWRPDAWPAAPFARLPAVRPPALKDSRMKVSSASTIPLSFLGLSAAGAPRNRCRQRNAVVGCTRKARPSWQAFAFDHRRAWSNQRSFVQMRHRRLGERIEGAPQLLQRNRESHASVRRRSPSCAMRTALARHSLMAARPKASGRRPRFAPLSVAPPAAEVSVSPPPEPPSKFAKAAATSRRCSTLSRQRRKPDGKLFGLHRIKLLKPHQPNPYQCR